MPLETKIYANAFNLIYELGPIKLGKIFSHFEDLKTAWGSNTSAYVRAGIDPKTAAQIADRKKTIDPGREYERLEKHQIQVLLSKDPAYPVRLREIPAFPPVLYVRGNAKCLSSLSLGVVGTRKMTPYGKQVVQELIPGITAHGLAVVSGLAFGVDFEALKACIENNGMPIAVLASAIDDASISPRSNFNLAQDVINSGCLISEYPLDSSVQKQNFPIRNRIISGLSIGTLVIEADQESGALITANYALEQNRLVFAVPGPIFSPSSRGTNNLIKAGAKLVSGITDITEELNLDLNTVEVKVPEASSGDESMIIEGLNREPIHIDELIKKLKLPANKVTSTLTILELKGRVKNLGGSNYVKVR